jgi:hypothetical protein
MLSYGHPSEAKRRMRCAQRIVSETAQRAHLLFAHGVQSSACFIMIVCERRVADCSASLVFCPEV